MKLEFSVTPRSAAARADCDSTETSATASSSRTPGSLRNFRAEASEPLGTSSAGKAPGRTLKRSNADAHHQDEVVHRIQESSNSNFKDLTTPLGPLTSQRAPVAVQEDLEDEEDLERLDELLWPLLPLFGARAATVQRGELAFGSFAQVFQTARSRKLLY